MYRPSAKKPFAGTKSNGTRFAQPKRNYACNEPTKRKEFAIRHLSPGVGRMTDIELVSGSGSWVFDSNGNKYLDFTCGIGVTNTGHCHPKVVKAAQDQLGKLFHGQLNIVWHNPMLDLVEQLKTITPKGLDRYFFWNSGSEAVEAAVKLARHATKKQNIIAFQGGYHGRTVGTMSLTTSKTIYRAGFGPLMPGCFITQYPYCHHCPVKQNVPNDSGCCNEAIKQLKLMFKQQTAPSETAAVLIEPILGEGGYVVPPPGFLSALREICTENNVLLIADEVQSGMGRTGKFFCMDGHFGVIPDILIFAKGISSGLPLSGIASTYELMQTQPPGSMGGTFAGNAVSCAAAIATIQAMKEEKMLDNVVVKGKQLVEGLQKLKKKVLCDCGHPRSWTYDWC